MLRVLRDNLRYLSWILWAVILVFIFFVFAEWGGAGRQLQGGQQVALEVDGDPITFPELDRVHRNLQRTYGQLYGGQIPAEISQQLQLPVQAVQQLIRQRLMVQEANETGLIVSDRELGERMLELPVFRNAEGEFIGDDNYMQTVRSMGYPTPKSFENAFRQDLLVEKLTATIRDTVDVTEDQVEAEYRRQNETARIDYLLSDSAPFAEGLDASDEQIQSYFAENIEEFRLPERRVVRYLLVDPAEIRDSLTVDDAQVEIYFQENADEYRREERVQARQILLRTDGGRTEEQARAELTSIRQQLQTGADFGELASSMSEDPASRERGGDMGYFARGEILPEVENVAFASEPGQLVGPIQTAFGMHLIEVLDHQQGGLPPFDEIKEQVRGRMLNERATQSAAERAQSLASIVQGSDEPADTWPQLAEDQVGVSFAESAPFSRNEPIPGLGFSPQFSNEAFALDLDQPSTAIAVGQGWAILDLVRVDPPRLPEPDEVEADARQRFLQDRAVQLAFEQLTQAKSSIESGASLASIGNDLNLQVESPESFNREGSLGNLGQPSQLMTAALAAAENEFIGPFEVETGAVLAQVMERVEFDRDSYLAARDQTEQTLREEQASRILESLLQRRQELAKIDYSPDLSAQLESLG